MHCFSYLSITVMGLAGWRMIEKRLWDLSDVNKFIIRRGGEGF